MRDFISELLDASEKLNPKEFEKWNKERISKDLETFEIWKQAGRQIDQIKDHKKIKYNLPIIEEFFKDLEKDKRIKINTHTNFADSTEDAYFIGQSRKNIPSHYEIEDKDYKKAITAINKFYEISYETFTLHLKKYAELIKQSKINSKGKVINILKTYKDDKYLSLFSPLNPIIRNAISHKSIRIDNKYPQAIYKDQNHPPITLSLKELKELNFNLFYLILSFDVVEYKLKEHFLADIQSKVNRVNKFLKDYNLKLKKSNNSPSIYEWGQILEQMGKK